MPTRRAFLAGCGGLLMASAPSSTKATELPLIAAASDLQHALDEILARLKGETGQLARVSYGSSGLLARQIAAGSPHELFLSADESYVLDLVKRGAVLDDGVLYALGRIVLFVPTGSNLAADGSLADLGAALGDGRLTRLAIANPEHAPYGRAAREALQSRGLWAGIERRLVLGENVSQAAQFAISGSLQGGIIALSLAISPAMTRAGRYATIPADWHQPLRQRMALTRRAGVAARRIFAYLQDAPAREILTRFGFALPTEP